jgi:hypothetical protein
MYTWKENGEKYKERTEWKHREEQEERKKRTEERGWRREQRGRLKGKMEKINKRKVVGKGDVSEKWVLSIINLYTSSFLFFIAHQQADR